MLPICSRGDLIRLWMLKGGRRAQAGGAARAACARLYCENFIFRKGE